MILEIRLQNTLWEARNISGPGYSVVEILDEIQSAKENGELNWVDWSQPLRLDIKLVER